MSREEIMASCYTKCVRGKWETWQETIDRLKKTFGDDVVVPSHWNVWKSTLEKQANEAAKRRL